MKKILSLSFILFLLTSCSPSNSSSSSISSSFIGKEDVSTIIKDVGSNEQKRTYYVGKIENSEGDRILPFNTDMSITTYSDSAYNNLTPVYDYHIKRLHILCDRYNTYLDEKGNVINNLKVINDSYGKKKEIKIDQDLFNILEMSIELSKLSEGYFNPTMGCLIDGWSKYFSPYGLTNNEFTIDDELNIISNSNSIVNFNELENIIELDKKNLTIKFNKYHQIDKVIISLGALAKGYAIDYLRQKFEKHDTPLLLSGSASSSYLKGNNPHPDRDNWALQINSPFKNDFAMSLPLLISSVTPEKVVSTSGDYEQLFYYENNDELIRRHHILNPYTGHSENYYRSITLYSEKRSDILDGLSTALFNIEDFNKVLKIINEVENAYNINIDYLFQKEINQNKVQVIYNEGFSNTITFSALTILKE